MRLNIASFLKSGINVRKNRGGNKKTSHDVLGTEMK